VDLLLRRALLDPANDPSMPEDSDRERLRLHPLLRELAADLLDTDTTPGAHDAAALALASFYAKYVIATPDAALGPDAATIAGALEWSYASAPDAVRDPLVALLSVGMDLYWRDRGRTTASLRYLPWGIAALRAQDAASSHSRLGYLLRDYGDAHLTAGHTAEAERQFRAALQFFQDAQDDLGAAQLLVMVGRVEALRGHLEAADQAYREAESVFRQLGNQQSIGSLLNNIGELARQRGQLAEAENYFQQSLAISREAQDRPDEEVALGNLGTVALQRGQLEQAEDHYQQALVISREIQDRLGEGVGLANLGQIAEGTERWDDAEQFYREGLHALRATEDAINSASIASILGQLLIERQGKPDEGCQLLAEAISIYHRMGLEDNEQEVRDLAQRLGCAL
jgi:tetratricopeptide (TPR) repeat protein